MKDPNEGEGVYLVRDGEYIKIPDDVAQRQYKKYKRIFIAGEEIKIFRRKEIKDKSPINWNPDLKVTVNY